MDLIKQMRIQNFSLHSYEIPLNNGQMRPGIFIRITDEKNNESWGDIAPLPKWSKETLEDSIQQLNQKRNEITKIDWTAWSCLKELEKLELLPAVSFGLESALLSILFPLSAYSVRTSALLMGSTQEILEQAELRHSEGYTLAKLKVGNLNTQEATDVIHQLKDQFRLRIDVNRSWTTTNSIRFFEQFPLDAFDYVEEPFQNPHDLGQFTHPLAIDESFPQDLSLKQLESFPTLKALVYKPTIQGGMLGCLSLYEWTIKRGISLVLSSSFESDLGLAYIASIAQRLSLSTPVGIGTYHYLNEYRCTNPLRFSQSVVSIPNCLTPKISSRATGQLL
jgi:O-succinylbenzoate synthase